MASSIVEVCAAVILRNGRFLLATRRPGSHLAGKWEFPGGKIREGEAPEQCIRREISEELMADVEEPRQLFAMSFDYAEHSVNLHFMLCLLPDGVEPRPAEGQKCAWFSPDELWNLDMAPADAAALERILKNKTVADRLNP